MSICPQIARIRTDGGLCMFLNHEVHGGTEILEKRYEIECGVPTRLYSFLVFASRGTL